jgi:hypothetical protein
MNISDPLWSSSKASDDFTSIASKTNSSNTSGFLQYQTDAIIHAISSSSSHLFTLKEFLYVGFATTVITVGIPLLGIKIYRVTLQLFLRTIASWQIAVAPIILADLLIPPFAPRLTFPLVNLPQIIIGLCGLGFKPKSVPPLGTWLKGTWQKRWMVYVALATVCIFNYDVECNSWALVPINYLSGLALLTNDGQLLFRYHLLSKDTTMNIPDLRKKYYKRGIWLLSSFYIALSVSSIWNPFLSYYFTAIFFGIYTGLYGLNKLRASISLRKNQVEWIGFMIIVGASVCLDVFVFYSTTLPTVPFFYHICWRLWVNDQVFIKKYLPDWINFRKQQIGREVDTENGRTQEIQDI